MKFSKNGFPIVFLKCDLTRGGGGLNISKKKSEKTKPSGMCQSFGGNMGEAQFHQCPFIPPPPILRILPFKSKKALKYWETIVRLNYKI